MKTTRALGACACTLSVVAALSTAADETTDTFEDGINLGGWVISGAGTINPSGGNPGAWLHRTVDTFAPIARTTIETGTPFVGDYRAMGVTTLSLDAQTLHRDFGPPTGFNFSVVLRDTKGTGPVDDDDYAYFVGPEVPLPGQGWRHYDFDIPSQSTADVPSGWRGGWVGDLENFRPGVTWSDVITSVDRVEFWWIDPSFFAIIAVWEVGVDNISIVTQAGEVASLTGFEVATGALLEGGLPELEESDDAYVRTRSGFGHTFIDLHHMEAAVTATTGVQNPQFIDLRFETRIDEPAGTAQIRLRNHTSGQLDTIGSFALGNGDELQTIEDVDASEYVNSQGEIELSIKHLVFVNFFAFTFESSIDLVEIIIE